MTAFAIQSFGCRANQAEAFEWAARLRARGLNLDRDAGASDLVIVNTCTLTARADRDARRFVQRAARENPGARIVVTGCLAERAPEAVSSWPGVWQVVPNADKAALPDLLAPAAEGEPPAASSGRPFLARALLKIQDGCDMSCCYCIIPRVRGRGVSLPAERVLERVRDLAGQGFGEIVLTGIHLSSYGRDLDPPGSLVRLLEAVERVPGDFRIRLSSLDPRLLPGDLVDHLTASPRICSHFHLSLQHASAEVLRAMGRRNDPEACEDLLRRMRRGSPEAALGADVIAGFPGETEAQFEAATEFLTRAPLSYLHVFSFSPRPGTPAAGRLQVDGAEKRRRARLWQALSRRQWLAFRRSFAGRELDGVVIRPRSEDAEVLTSNAIEVRVPRGALRDGRRVRVRLRTVEGRNARGEALP